MIAKRTDELKPGDRVRLIGGLIRTVAEVRPNGHRNFRNQPLYDVLYAEGKTPQWSHGNSGAGYSWWEVLES